MKESSVLNNKLLTIAPTSQFKDDAASFAVRADSSKTITLNNLLKFLSAFSALLTGSLSNKLIFQLTID
jgi:hypothetical protein